MLYFLLFFIFLSPIAAAENPQPSEDNLAQLHKILTKEYTALSQQWATQRLQRRIDNASHIERVNIETATITLLRTMNPQAVLSLFKESHNDTIILRPQIDGKEYTEDLFKNHHIPKSFKYFETITIVPKAQKPKCKRKNT